MNSRFELNFSTKARTLSTLIGQIKTADILPLHFFSVGDWNKNASGCIERISELLNTSNFIVRSSSRREDSLSSSGAGAFKSVQNVGTPELAAAISEVIESYQDPSPLDEVLIQPMLEHIVRSGVAFSHDPNTCSPYRVINWTEGQDSAAVTGGKGGEIWQAAATSNCPAPVQIASVIPLVEELLKLFEDQPLDVEFAITSQNGSANLWLLQVRPLILRSPPESPEQQATRLEQIEKQVRLGMRPHPFLMGKSTVYGVMPDWNPAEIVGTRPKSLALSLYRELITDSIWAYQRHNYGYRNLRSFPLMQSFFGLPYIDVRLSFNSFIPASLDEELAGRLVDYYTDRLVSEPTLHDKVEFDIVFSCYTLDIRSRLTALRQAGFSTSNIEDIASALRQLTNNVLHPEHGLWKRDAEKVSTLVERRERLLASERAPIERIYWLMEDGKRYGTLPFAGLARAGFIAMQFLRSLVAEQLFSQSDYDGFIGSISTVGKQLAHDRALLDRTSFLSRYGHLRPGTYDILSPRYDEQPELYFDWSTTQKIPSPDEPFRPSLGQLKDLSKILDDHELECGPADLLIFMQSAIELRESSKFHFTRNLSEMISLIGQVGSENGFSREEMAFCDIGVFRELYLSADDAKKRIAKSIELGKEKYFETSRTILPPLIKSPEDVWAFKWPQTEPNFITQKQVTASVTTSETPETVSGKIVCIPSADPGFDWLFAYPIAGLITAWGGVNSHMAIRAGELGLPAVIGAGEIFYQRWSTANRIHLDCGGRKVEILP